MIIRIVRMHFKEAGEGEFITIFHASKEAIRSFPGCTHLQLFKDINNEHTYTSWSHWLKEEDLENYRKSELFEKVWSKVKPLFSDRPQAFSLEKFIEV